ncbi:MAG TPA: FmdB family zinc ribbon protein [Jatrophihabitans sp.]|jgi:putative FmdB family regulatory protein
MPTYQYACTNAECGNRFEQVQSFSDAALTVCPVCSERLRKVYGSVGVVFKGSGFYRNDSRDAKVSATAPAPSNGSSHGSSDGSSAASDSGKSDSAAKSSDGSSAKSKSDSSKESSSTSSKTAAAAAG